jgi:lipopolysaccharide/colanic/teichoic acid biosynthesis glycosyltransferase
MDTSIFETFEASLIAAHLTKPSANNIISISFRRFFDVFFSVGMLVFLTPLMLIVALAIKIDSKGPVFYRQSRVGLNEVSFKITKFRSMCADAEKSGLAVWAAPSDSRVTRFGRLMRKYRIDELPQFLDVVRGDMSVVGPRPERPEFVAILQDSIPDYDLRHAVKPGITGLAQVRYCYGASIDDAKIKHIYDTEYLKTRSLLLDGKILFETVAVVLFGKGAR